MAYIKIILGLDSVAFHIFSRLKYNLCIFILWNSSMLLLSGADLWLRNSSRISATNPGFIPTPGAFVFQKCSIFLSKWISYLKRKTYLCVIFLVKSINISLPYILCIFKSPSITLISEWKGKSLWWPFILLWDVYLVSISKCICNLLKVPASQVLKWHLPITAFP